MLQVTFLDRSSFEKNIIIRQPNFHHQWINFENTAPDQVIEHIGDSEIVLTNKVVINRETILASSKLKHIAVTATGYNIIDMDACRERNITVSNIPSYAITTVPEHVLSCAIALRRQLLRYRQLVIEGKWQQSSRFCLFDEPIYDLRGAVFGLVGFGQLGQATAKLMQAIGMSIIYNSPSDKKVDFAQHVTLDQLLERADIVSLHCPLLPTTENLISKIELDKMKESAILINTARGGVVDEYALVEAIRNRSIAGAAIDVLTQEPPTQTSSPLLSISDLDNVILTPHTGWASQQAMQSLSDQLIDNIEAFAAGQPINLVS